MKQIAPSLIKPVSPKNVPSQASFFNSIFFLKRVILFFVILQIHMLTCGFDAFGQEIELTGKVVNMNQEPVSNVRITLQSMPEIYCYSDSSGNFSLVSDNALGIEDLIANNQSVYLLENGSLLIDVNNTSLNISIFDMMGRNLGTIVKEKNLNGKYTIYPSAYIQGLANGIYIARVKLGNYQKAVKFFNVTELSPLGLHYYGSSNASLGENISAKSTHDARAEDTVVFEQDFYKTTHVLTSNLISDLGIVELENFGDYSIPPNMIPDKADLYSLSGNVLNLFGKDSTEFIIHFSPYSIFNDKLTLKAIPIDELEGLAPGVDLISAVHLEPAGTKFNLPAMVSLNLKDIPVTDDLVVFLYDDINNKTYYIPYYDQSDYYYDIYSITFFLSHFSDIGIGHQPELPVTSGLITSDDFVTIINYHIAHDQEFPDDYFTVWFEEVVLKAIDAVSNIENLQDAISEISLLNTYINFVNKNIADFVFYDELTSSLATKINYVFQGINNECESISDPCTKIDLARIALTLVNLTQQIDGIEPLNYTTICNGEVLEMVVDFVMEEATVNIEVSEQKQINIDAQNILKEEILSDEIDIEWTSEDPNIASVNEVGTVTGLNQGTVKVFAEYCGIRRYVFVNVDQDINYCDLDKNKYSGTVSHYKNTMNDGEGCIFTSTIRILANMNDKTYTGSWFSTGKCTSYIYNPSIGWHWVTTVENQSDQVHPYHRLGNLVCNRVWPYSLPYWGLDTQAFGIHLFPESNTIKSDYNDKHGIGVLTRVE